MDEDELRPATRRQATYDEDIEEDEEDGTEEAEEDVDETEDESEEEVLRRRGRRSAQPTRAQLSRQGDPTIIPWAREIGVDPQKMHVMQTSLFRMPEEERVLKALNEPQPRRKLLQLKSALTRKHSRDSEGEGLRADSRQRASFADDIEPEVYRPSRKYARVESSASAFVGREGAYVDAGLALGRSFRVGWGPGGLLLHLGELCGPSSTPTSSANVSTVKMTTVPLLAGTAADASAQASRLLSHHLHHTVIEEDEDGVPFANPSPKLSFASFVSQFPSTDQSFEPTLFRLGRALFDTSDYRLEQIPDPSARQRISDIRRKTELSNWLKTAVSSATESDLRKDLDARWDRTLFTLLSGYQIERACEKAANDGNVKLASLIAQCPGDAAFRADLQSQLDIWREQRTDAHISEDTRKVYALLAGVVDTLQGSGGSGVEQCPDVDLAKGLDWKRAFGLQLWFGMPMDASIADVFQEYDRLWREGLSSVAAPVPWYAERPFAEQVASKWTAPSNAQPTDALYALIKLFADPACNLSSILSSFSFSASPADYRLPWHLYIILSRCMRIRDLADRDTSVRREEDEEEGAVEGHSPSADLLANSYASQLEQLGMVQEAVFVLLHLEAPAGRVKAIKELLTRSASKLDDWVTRGLVGSLKIPMTWINEAKAIYALDSGSMYDAYELYLQAGLYDTAHDIAVVELAPDAVIRQDLILLREMLEPFEGHSVNGWNERGRAFMDYTHAVTRLPQLRERLVKGHLSADEAAELDQLARSVPKLISILPEVLPDRSNIRHNAALTEMTSKLVHHLDRTRPLAVAQSQIRTPFFNDATRVRNIHSTMYEKFLRTVDVS
ncbi:hypothetical protein DICSQDRAFT_157411 [Dichomitus squalens LYAD-421 SS1]|uniref:Nuclear pore complex protein NUP96 C-terminal domain-containing protein n=1 Tax=Dichomitus squalens (strain LYAD-421) TaxID=732165 RepID=R7SNT1_DICSQ|nr:uncharacterized protein DICSQDRAFT_157411 [Dichomitus squalens LYAD-421 SS1]EJF57390.1 hypothetical protein DICSQDRAFT_157411 [Dichomitus squalens LYAD-421 SS1]